MVSPNDDESIELDSAVNLSSYGHWNVDILSLRNLHSGSYPRYMTCSMNSLLSPVPPVLWAVIILVAGLLRPPLALAVRTTPLISDETGFSTVPIPEIYCEQLTAQPP